MRTFKLDIQVIPRTKIGEVHIARQVRHTVCQKSFVRKNILGFFEIPTLQRAYNKKKGTYLSKRNMPKQSYFQSHSLPLNSPS